MSPAAFPALRDKIDTDDFNHPRKMYDLTAAPIHRGYSDSNIEAVLGGNFRRLLGSTWTETQKKTGGNS
jgi:membrane dipeptidase